MSIPDHDPDCWCVVCGTDRIHASIDRKCAEYQENKKLREEKKKHTMYLVTCTDVMGLIDFDDEFEDDATIEMVRVFKTQGEAEKHASSMAKTSNLDWYVHAIQKTAQVKRGKL